MTIDEFVCAKKWNTKEGIARRRHAESMWLERRREKAMIDKSMRQRGILARKLRGGKGLVSKRVTNALCTRRNGEKHDNKAAVELARHTLETIRGIYLEQWRQWWDIKKAEGVDVRHWKVW